MFYAGFPGRERAARSPAERIAMEPAQIPPYVHQPYPSVRYHPELGTRIVADSAESDTAIADGWYETPADFPQPDTPKKKK